MKAMIFAAGMGTRLRPFTLHHPKALVEVKGKPMLQRVIERLKGAGITDIVINVHHFAGQIADFLSANSNFGCDMALSDESERLLDTGGGIAKAAALLGDDAPFIAYNADILSDFDINEMIGSHMSSCADVTLLTSARQSSRQLYFDHGQHLCGWRNHNTGECRPATFHPDATVTPASFNGVHIISPKVLPLLQRQASTNPVFSITPFYLDNCQCLDIRPYTPSCPYQWYDIGRSETLEKARCEFHE